jgi:hypothetical protein
MSFQAADIAPVDLSEVAAAFSGGEVENAAKPLRRIDTHLSHVFLTDTLVYKLRRHKPTQEPIGLNGKNRRVRAAGPASLATAGLARPGHSLASLGRVEVGPLQPLTIPALSLERRGGRR